MGLNLGQVDPTTIQRMLFGGAQSMLTPSPDAQQPTPQSDPSTPTSPQPGAPPQAAPPPQAQAAPTAPAPKPEAAPASQQPGYSATPPSFDEYHQAHGDVPIAAPPPAPHHGTLAKIMLGVGEALGNPLATRIGERDRSLEQANQQFEQNKPAIQYQANRAGYESDLGNMQKVAETRRANIDADVAQQNLPMQKEAEARFNELRDAWQNKLTPPDANGDHTKSFSDYAQLQLSAMPPAIARMVQPHLAGITALPQTGKGYKINMQDDQPVSVEAYGKTYLPDKSGKFDPAVSAQAVADFQAAQQAHQAKFQEGQTIANNAAERQGEAQSRGFTQAAKLQQSTQDFATQQKGREAMMPALADIRAAENNQDMINRLGSAKDHASRSALSDQLAQALAPPGSKRLSPIAIDQLYDSGSISQKAAQQLKKWLSGAGPLPDETVPEWVAAAKTLNANKVKTANDSLEDIHSTYGVKHPNAGPNGRLDTVQPSRAPTQPKGATHTGIGDQDKKKHWLDAQGNDLGLAE